MEWDEPLEEADEEAGFAGPLGRYSGSVLSLTLGDVAYELRYEDDLLGVLTRPGQYMVGETSAGRWELRHPRRSIFKIDAVDIDGGVVAARYRRRLLSRRRRIATLSPRPYPMRASALELRVEQPMGEELLKVGPGDRSGDLAVEIFQEPEVTSDLDVLAVLSSYVKLVGDTSVSNYGGPVG